MISINERDGYVTFPVRVQPRASKTGIFGEIDGVLKIRVAAPPVDGGANRELVRFISKILHIPQSRIEIASGLGSRNKLVRVSGITVERCRSLFETRG